MQNFLRNSNLSSELGWESNICLKIAEDVKKARKNQFFYVMELFDFQIRIFRIFYFQQFLGQPSILSLILKKDLNSSENFT